MSRKTTLEEYIKHLSLPTPQPLTDDETERIYHLAKEQFYDFEEYKWRLNKSCNFIKKHRITPTLFIDALEHLFKTYHELRGNKPHKGAYLFIERLRSSKTFNSCAYSFDKIQMKEDTDILEFLSTMKTIHRNHLSIYQNTMIKFIFDNFNTGYTLSTLERKFKADI